MWLDTIFCKHVNMNIVTIFVHIHSHKLEVNQEDKDLPCISAYFFGTILLIDEQVILFHNCESNLKI